MRIVSLLPSATEIACDLGLGDDLVGITFECRWPEGVEDGRAVVVTGLETHGLTPVEIDELVRATVAAQGNLYTLHDDRFRDCAPDLVLTQDLCRVCALPSGDVDAALDRLGCSAHIVTLDPHTLDEVLATITTVADAAGVADRGAVYVDALRARLAAVRAAVAEREARSTFVLEWLDPPFLSGHWVPDVVAAAGGRPVLATPGERSVPTSWDEIAAQDPDVVVVAPCGFGLDGAAEQAAVAASRLPDHCEVWAIDADGYLVRPGPRLVAGAEQLAAVLHGVGEPDPAIVRRVR